jgi:predicted regulator of Ras-like GTPase activity (Roadblock/LC7/MglB family)
MAESPDFKTILENHPSIEAIISMSRDGLSLNSSTRSGKPIDEIVSIVAALYAAAMDANLVKADGDGRLFIDAAHGSLYCRSVDANTLLLLLTNDRCTEQQCERVFESWSVYRQK